MTTTIDVRIHVEETEYQAPTLWRMLGAKGKASHIRTLCERNQVQPQRLLEVGAGDGAILRCLGETGFCSQMHAVEISASGVAVILAQSIPGLVSCQTFNGYQLPFEDGYFDLVILSHVLEHVEFERVLLREIRRVSRHQVIEIPLDFTALRNEAFHLVGPSYGHINAHSPDSLRFLLSQEGLLVLDDILGHYPLDLREYDHFVNNGHERTPAAEAEIRARHDAFLTEFAAMPRNAQETRAAIYAVLTRRESADELRERVVAGMKASIASGQVQAARLIFGHYVREPHIVDIALEIAEHFADAKPAIALEYLDRARVLDPRNVRVTHCDVRITDAFQNAREAPPTAAAPPAPAPVAAAPAGARERLKRNFPALVPIVRRLRRWL